MTDYFMKMAIHALVVTALVACSVKPATNLQPLAGYPITESGLSLPAPKAGREQPVVAVLAHNEGAETTDFVIPYGVLSQSGAATVIALAPDSGTVPLFPALQVNIEHSFASFAASYPAGADVIIVPAFHNADDPRIISWLTEQADVGAIVVGICDGVWTLANAGLLDGRLATGHWFSLNGLADQFPETRWVSDRRYLVDGNVITTSGVSASIPVSLALVEAIAGPQRARSVAAALNMGEYSDVHNAYEFGLSAGLLAEAVLNTLQFWRHEDHLVSLHDGIDEIALALTADAWSRTYRSRALGAAESSDPVRSARGLQIVPDTTLAGNAPERRTMLTPAMTLKENLANIESRYGSRTAEFVAQQLEYRRIVAPQTVDNRIVTSYLLH